LGIGLQVGRVRVERLAVDQFVLNGLQHDLIKDLLVDTGDGEAVDPVAAESRVIRHLARQPEAEKPAVGVVDLDLPHQPALRADAKQVVDEPGSLELI